MTLDYRKLNQVVTLIAAAAADVVPYSNTLTHLVHSIQLLIYQMPLSQ